MILPVTWTSLPLCSSRTCFGSICGRAVSTQADSFCLWCVWLLYSTTSESLWAATAAAVKRRRWGYSSDYQEHDGTCRRHNQRQSRSV